MRAPSHPLLLAIVVVAGYGIAPGRLPLIGEEACRALHGIEMARSGDWLIPTQQGVQIIDRPPLQYWTLALIQRFVHPLDPFTLRFTMLVLTFLTGLVVWLYARKILTPAAALVAGLAYPTIGHVFDLGRRVETDGLFALLLAGSLLVWHHGYREGWGPGATWTAGCAVAALATLAKGTQGPVVFFGTVWLYLVLRRDWRFLRSGGHAWGLLVFVGLISIWMIPFQLRTGWEGARMTWIDPFTRRVDSDPLQVVRHLLGFPIAVLAAGLPWSVLAFGLARRRLWSERDAVRSSLGFALLGILVILAPVWLSADGKTRYVMPIYPLLAFVCGAVVHRALEPDAPADLRRLWRGLVAGTAGLLAVATLGLAALQRPGAPTDAESIAKLRQPWWLLALLFAAAAATLLLAVRGGSRPGPQRLALQAFALALVTAIAFNGPVLNASAWNTDHVQREVAALRRQLPAQPHLRSFGPLHQKFVYWYGEPIPILSEDRVPHDLEYFAIDVVGDEPVELPFAFEELARIDMDPKRKPRIHVLVGRRLPVAADPHDGG